MYTIKTMKKILLLLLLVAAFAVSVFSQNKPDKKFNPNPFGGRNGYQISMGFFNHFEADVSYIMTTRPRQIVEPDYGTLLGFQTISTGINYACANNNSYVGPKVYLQGTFLILTAQAGLDYLTNFKQPGIVRFTPKAGLSLAGFVSILYGKNYALGKTPETIMDSLVGKGILHLQLQMPLKPRQPKK
jgi:hypothetical protein